MAGKYFRQLFISIILGVAFTLVPQAYADEQPLPVAKNLVEDARLAKKKNIPILVFFAAPDCPYCEEVEELYLKPMFNSKKYAGKVIFRVIRIDSVRRLRDFRGNLTSHDKFSSGLFVNFTPTIRLFRYDGKELTELYGYGSPDYYYYDLQETIRKSINKLRGRTS